MTAKPTTPVPVRHRPQIERRLDAAGRKTYRLSCACGHTGQEHAARRMADCDLNDHILALPRVPAAEQCRDPQRHGCRHWEPCSVCRDQLPLFDLGGDP
jgi:hypothetical protein